MYKHQEERRAWVRHSKPIALEHTQDGFHLPGELPSGMRPSGK